MGDRYPTTLILMIEWQPSGKYWKLMLGQILKMRDRGLLTIWADERDGKRIYVITPL